MILYVQDISEAACLKIMVTPPLSPSNKLTFWSLISLLRCLRWIDLKVAVFFCQVFDAASRFLGETGIKSCRIRVPETLNNQFVQLLFSIGWFQTVASKMGGSKSPFPSIKKSWLFGVPGCSWCPRSCFFFTQLGLFPNGLKNWSNLFLHGIMLLAGPQEIFVYLFSYIYIFTYVK